MHHFVTSKVLVAQGKEKQTSRTVTWFLRQARDLFQKPCHQYGKKSTLNGSTYLIDRLMIKKMV